MEMIELVDRFPAQLKEALNIGQKANITKHSTAIRNVFVAGIGGSGIGANFTQDFTVAELKVPFLVGKGYEIPQFINKNTLAIVSSYSGNTEETLSAFDLLLQTGAKIVCIASGGKVIAKAKELGLDYIQLPSGWPSPRACVGFSFIQQLFILNKLKLISNKTIKQIEGAIKLLEKEKEYAEKFANPYRAAARGFIDEVIEPRETRRKLIKAFTMLENKVVHQPKKKHGNIPL